MQSQPIAFGDKQLVTKCLLGIPAEGCDCIRCGPYRVCHWEDSGRCGLPPTHLHTAVERAPSSLEKELRGTADHLVLNIRRDSPKGKGRDWPRFRTEEEGIGRSGERPCEIPGKSTLGSGLDLSWHRPSNSVCGWKILSIGIMLTEECLL